MDLSEASISDIDENPNVVCTIRRGGMTGKHHSEESKRKMSIAHRNISMDTRLKMSAARKGMTFSEEQKRKMGLAQRGRHHTEETRKKMSLAAKGVPKLLLRGRPHPPDCPHCIAIRGRAHPPNCPHCLAIMGDKNPAKRPEVADKISRNNPSHRPEVRLKQHLAGKGRKKTIEHRRALSVAQRNPDTNRKRFQTFAKNHPKCVPNNTELYVLTLIERALGKGTYKYNDGFFVLCGKIPDYVNCTGPKKLIEFLGCSWHGCKLCYPNTKMKDKTEDRVKLFKENGYDTLIIWRHDLDDVDAVIERIRQFGAVVQQ